MDDIAKVSEANGGEIDFCNFGDVSNPEGRKQTITTILKGVSSGFLSELKKYEETFGTEDLSNMFDHVLKSNKFDKEIKNLIIFKKSLFRECF